MEGEGICVTPKTNCPQSILAQEVNPKKQPKYFPKIISSGLINPLLGGAP